MFALHRTNHATQQPVSLGAQIAAHCRDSGRADGVERIQRLAAAEAWTDAALALIALEEPRWRLRRLAREDGEWHCALSRQPDLPLGLDDCAEARNEQMVVAILDAHAEARDKDRASAALPQCARRAAPPATVTPACDNFG